MEPLLQKVQFLKGVGPRRSECLARLGIADVFDLFWHIPRAYFDQSQVKAISGLVPAEKASIVGRVVAVDTRRTRRQPVFRALLQDDSGTLPAVWFNQAFLSRLIQPGHSLFLSGRLGSYGGQPVFYVSEYEVLEEENQALRILPVYPLTSGLTQKAMRALVSQALQERLVYYPEIFDSAVRDRCQLCDINYAFYNIHFPSSPEACQKARRRLALEELFLFHYELWQRRQADRVNGVSHRARSGLVKRIVDSLPFGLTKAQQRVLNLILRDMESTQPMNRLLQGDVGAGKTIVALLAMAQAVDSGCQAAMMVPTDILAKQHFQALKQFLEPHGVIAACLRGATGAAERQQIVQSLAEGSLDVLVGTHALLQENINFKELGLVVIDEQHRFGVKQRARLGVKGPNPDLLIMTATPIPRTLALTLYGDLDLAVIDELPPGRKPVKTRVVAENKRKQVYSWLRDKLLSQPGTQAYIICPLVEESEDQDLKAAQTLFDELRQGILQELPVGMLHGRLRPGQKDQVMEDFKEGRIKALVATTVVEVGVDVPSATIMVVEHAERFGLSQLHQLRGRVGRGSRQSFCLLLSNPRTEEAWRRLQAMERSSDGFYLAKEDLAIRGPGEILGFKQHGINQFKAADLLEDRELIELSLELAKSYEPDSLIMNEYFERKFVKPEDVLFN